MQYVNGVWENHYRIFFKCKSCGISVESKNENYNTDPPKEITYEEKVEMAKKQKNLKIGWTVTEEIGDCIINDYAMAKISV